MTEKYENFYRKMNDVLWKKCDEKWLMNLGKNMKIF